MHRGLVNQITRCAAPLFVLAAATGGCVAPPTALLPLGPLRSGLPARPSDQGDLAGIVEAGASAGSDLRQLEGRGLFMMRTTGRTARIIGGAGLVASGIHAVPTSGPASKISMFGAAPIAHLGVEIRSCAVEVAGIGGAMVGPSVALVGGMIELAADCSVGPWTFGLRGLKHSYSSGPQDSRALGAAAVVSFRPRLAIVAPTISVMGAARRTTLIDDPQDGERSRYDDRGWLAGIALGVTFETRRH